MADELLAQQRREPQEIPQCSNRVVAWLHCCCASEFDQMRDGLGKLSMQCSCLICCRRIPNDVRIRVIAQQTGCGSNSTTLCQSASQID